MNDNNQHGAFRRGYTLAGLRERIIMEFLQEHAPNPTALLDADTVARRMALILQTTDYVIAVAAASLSDTEKTRILQEVYSEIFGYGPLDRLLLDDRITTISLAGLNHVAVRYGHGELQPLGQIFEDEQQFQRILRRMVRDAGAEPRDNLAYLELGLPINDRHACINLITPAVSSRYTAQDGELVRTEAAVHRPLK